jgi:aldehyde:ferredoxin oxidoreductase
MPNGFMGKILRVNLTDSKISEVPTSKYVPKYIGGRGIATRVYWEEVGPEVKAFDPENKLIFMTGPLVGTLAPASGRLTLVSKSPQTYPTESIADSNIGGFFGPELKFAGYDGIIIEGKAPKPIYLWITDEQVHIMDAIPLWGLTTSAAQVEIWRKHGWKTRILVIGQAGENLSRIATIQSDAEAFGQGGYGGVMGSKNLKAIAVRGTGSIRVARPGKLLKMIEDLRKLTSVRAGETVIGFEGAQVGQEKMHRGANLGHALCFDKDSKMADMIKSGLVKAGAAGCWQCPVSDRTYMQFIDDSLPSCSAQCSAMLGYKDREQAYYGGKSWGKAQYMHTLFIGLYGINAWEVLEKRMISLIERLAKDGVLTNENTGWPLDKIGSQEFLEVFLRDIAYARGFGAICAQGCCRMVEHIVNNEEFGPNRAEILTTFREMYPMSGNFSGYSSHHNVLGRVMEYSAALYWLLGQRDPESKHTDEHFYCGGIQFGLPPIVPAQMPVEYESDKWYGMLKPKMKRWIGTDKPIEPPGYEDAELATRWWWQQAFETDCLPLCDMWQQTGYWTPYTVDGIGNMEDSGSKLLSAVMGEDISQEELWARCEVPWILQRAIACREGRRAKDDEYTDEFIAATAPRGVRMEKAKLRALTDKFYELVGWNSNGVPTRARLEQLDLKDVADDLEARGVL